MSNFDLPELINDLINLPKYGTNPNKAIVFTPLSTIFQLYRGVQFYCWRKQEYPEKTLTCRKNLHTCIKNAV
jgi:hypothetical protein